MSSRMALPLGALLLAGLAAPVAAQMAIPSAPAPPAVPATPGLPAAPAQPVTIWNKLGISKQNCQACRERCCKSPLGQLLNNMTKPLGLMTGGLVQPLCPTTPSADQLAKLMAPDSNASLGEKVAAKIKADEAGAAARRAAIRYLGTVDCHYYPEAEDALVAGLRNDRNECVRLEAALALGKGCCCTKKTVQALAAAASGEEDGKNPGETSERVKSAALVALMHCMGRGVSDKVEPPLPPERPPEAPVPPEAPPVVTRAPDAPVVQAAAHQTVATRGPTDGQIVLGAARLLAQTAGTTPGSGPLPTGRRNLMQIMESASTSPGAREEIPFEEAALGNQPPQPSSRARLGFEIGRLAPLSAPAPPMVTCPAPTDRR